MSRLTSPAKALNLSDAFLDENVRAGRGDKIALVVDAPAGASEHSYADLLAQACQVGHELAARGLQMEDRVFIILEDSLEWVTSFFGAQRIGCTTMFLNPRTNEEELAFYLADSRAHCVITTASIAAMLPADRPYVKTVLIVDDPKTRASIAAQPSELACAPTSEEDFAIWLYSSGSTGAPKAAVHRAADFIYNAARYPKEVLRMDEHDRTLSVPKLFFGYATGSNLFFPFYYGGSAILFPDKPTPERLFELVERHRATMLINVPTMISQMVEVYETKKAEGKAWDVSSLRVLTSAGEALPPELYERWKKSLDIEILDGIGSAEMFHVYISARFGEVQAGSLGRIVEGYEAKLMDPDGREVGPGEIGTMWVGGGSSAAFYWQRAEKSRETLQGHWVITSDQFEKDARGNFFYKGRADDLMKIAGRWLAPQEVEDALTRHEAVAEAGAAPFSQDGLLKPMAFVILREGQTADEALEKQLSQHVADTTLPYKAPRFIEFVSALPRSDRDKLARAELKKMAELAAKRRGINS